MKSHISPILNALGIFAITQTANAASGTWTQLTSGGLWSDGGNWSGGIIADASSFTANFNTLNITSDNTVHLDSDRTLTTLIFGDTTASSAASWILDNDGVTTNNLILAGSEPVVTVNALGTNKTATISAVIQGTNGLTKAGSGTLVLSGANSYTGNTIVAGGGRLTVNGTGSITSSSSILNLGPSTGSFTSTAGTFQYDSSATSSFGTINIGSTADGTLNQTDGTINVSGNVAMQRASNGNGTVNLSGGTLAVTGSVLVGQGYTSALTTNFNLSGTGILTAGSVVLADTLNNSRSSTGVLTQSGGTATIGSLVMGKTSTVGSGGTHTGTYNLNAGTLTAGSIAGGVTNSFGTSVSTFNFDGGTLKPSASSATFMQGLTTANVKNGGAKIDTSGFDISIAQALVNFSGATTSSLNKSGTGTLTLSAINTYAGQTIISGGKLTIAPTGTINSTSSVSIGAGDFNYNSATALSKGVSFSGTGGTLSGTGVITPAVTIPSGNRQTAGTSVTLANPAAILGKETFTTSIDYQEGSIFEWNLTANADTSEGIRGTDYDAIDTASLLNTGANAIFRVVLNGTENFDETFWNADRTWTDIFKNGATALNIETIFGTGGSVEFYNSAGFVGNGNTTGRSFTISGTTLNWSAVPEPTSALAGLLVGAGLIRRRRA